MSRLSRNIVYSLVGQGLILIVSFAAVKLIYRRLGEDAFGILYFNIALTAVVTAALEFGITSTTVREVASHFESEAQYVRDLVRTASFLYWTAGFCLCAVVLALAPIIVIRWVKLTTLDSGTAVMMLRILGVGLFVALPRTLYSSLFRGLQRFEVSNGIEVATYALQQIGVVILLTVGAPVVAVVSWISASLVIGTIAFIIMAARSFGRHALIPAFSMYVVRRNVRYSKHLATLTVTAMLYTQADKIIVSKLLPIAQFGLYSFASSTVLRASTITNAITAAAFPALATVAKAQDPDQLRVQYRKLQDLVSFGMVPVFVAVCFAALPVFGYLFSRSAAWVLLVPTLWLCLGTYMNGSLAIPYSFALAVGKPDIAARANILALFIVPPATVVLVWRLGLAGAGFSWVFYHLFLYSYMVPRVSRECLGTDPFDWFAQLARPLASGAVFYGLAWILIAEPGGYRLSALIAAYLSASAGYLVFAYLLMGPELRSTTRGLVAHLGIASSR